MKRIKIGVKLEVGWKSGLDNSETGIQRDFKTRNNEREQCIGFRFNRIS